MPEGELCAPARGAEGHQGWRCLLVVCDRDKTWRSTGDVWGPAGKAVRKELPLADALVEEWGWGEMLSCSRSVESVPDVSPGATAGWRLSLSSSAPAAWICWRTRREMFTFSSWCCLGRFAGSKGLEEEEEEG